MDQTEIIKKDYDLARVMKALGHPVRVSIIRKLLKKGACPNGCDICSCDVECCDKNCKCGCRCGELVDMFPKSQSTISRHLKELKDAGLIEISNRKGDYIINQYGLNEVLELLMSLLSRGKDDSILEKHDAKKCDCK